MDLHTCDVLVVGGGGAGLRAAERYDEFFVTKLLVDDGRYQGAVAVELTTGQVRVITAKAVILCTGGCGKIFPFTTNANIKNGDGMALAYRRRL